MNSIANFTSGLWAQLSTSICAVRHHAARLAMRLASCLARGLKPLLIACAVATIQDMDSDTVRLLALAQAPLREDLAHVGKLVRDLGDTVYDNSQRASDMDAEHFELHNSVLGIHGRIDKRVSSNEYNIEALVFELNAAKRGWAHAMREIALLKRHQCASSPSAKSATVTTRSDIVRSAATTKKSPRTGRITPLVSSSSVSLAVCKQTKAASSIRPPTRWRA